jgi:Secretion system C-terminal sorting domain
MFLKKSLLMLAIGASGFLVQAQSKMHEICGTTHEQEALTDRVKANREAVAKGIIDLTEARAVKYIPIKFHIIAKKDQTGRVSEAKILENLCQLNKDYADQEIVFYLAVNNGEPFNYIDDNNAYTNQSNGLGLASLKAQAGKFKNAINIFLAKETPSPGSQLGGTTLGYYSSSNDWLVIRNDQVNATSGTLSHELGHHFSLPHPFKGWDQQTCKDIYPTEWASGKEFQVTITKAPDGFSNVEFADKSNCKTAGDLFCDTPADYNFGFDWNGCTPFTKKIKDPNGNYVDPEENLFMGYFIGCSNYFFTKEQKDAVLADYLSAGRAKIRPNYTPKIVEVNQHVTPLYPNANDITAHFNNVPISWSSVPGADRYFLEIDVTSNFNTAPIRFVTTETTKVVSSLVKSKAYYYRVIPFHSETGTCLQVATATRIKFNTSEWGVNTKDIEDVAAWSVSPNPTAVGQSLFVNMEVTKPFEAEVALFNSVGQKVNSLGQKSFNEGSNRVEIATENLAPGLYNVMIQTGNTFLSKKVVLVK